MQLQQREILVSVPLIGDAGPSRNKIGKLCLPRETDYFGCRHCHSLTYRSCREHDSRVDAMVKNPEALLSQMRSGDSRGALLAIKAYCKIRGRRRRSLSLPQKTVAFQVFFSIIECGHQLTERQMVKIKQRLLVSVRGKKDTIEAVKGGAHIIDAEYPGSALGTCYPANIFTIRKYTPPDREVSTNIGEKQFVWSTAGHAKCG